MAAAHPSAMPGLTCRRCSHRTPRRPHDFDTELQDLADASKCLYKRLSQRVARIAEAGAGASEGIGSGAGTGDGEGEGEGAGVGKPVSADAASAGSSSNYVVVDPCSDDLGGIGTDAGTNSGNANSNGTGKDSGTGPSNTGSIITSNGNGKDSGNAACIGATPTSQDTITSVAAANADAGLGLGLDLAPILHLAPREIKRSRVTLLERLGAGAFGVVDKAKLAPEHK